MPTKNKQAIDPESAPAAAAANEVAADTVVTLDFGGETYHVDFAMMQSIAYLEAAQKGYDMLMVAALLPPGEWALFKMRHTMRSDVNEFTTAIAAAAGMGNS